MAMFRIPCVCGFSLPLSPCFLSLDQDDSPMDDMIETISSFLLSGGAADDDDEANSIAREIYETCCIQEDSLGKERGSIE